MLDMERIKEGIRTGKYEREFWKLAAQHGIKQLSRCTDGNDGVRQSYRLGASAVGARCIRQAWYKHKWMLKGKVSEKLALIGNMGDIEELRVLAMLKAAGYNVLHETATGGQFEYEGLDGNVVTYLDGVIWIEGHEEWAVLEIKSANRRRFSNMKKQGIFVAAPEYYDQVQFSMLLSGYRRALIVVICKDDEELYLEEVVADDGIQQMLLQKAEVIIGKDIPDRAFDGPESIECQWCDYRSLCWNGAEPNNKVCRNCRHYQIEGKGGTCTARHREEQPDGTCIVYSVIEWR